MFHYSVIGMSSPVIPVIYEENFEQIDFKCIVIDLLHTFTWQSIFISSLKHTNANKFFRNF